MLKSFSFILLFCSISFCVSGQSTDQWQNIFKAATDVTPSPTSAAMARFDSWHMNSSVGIPDISIPLYTIRLGKLELPINLSYHLGGIRVEEVPSWVGLGWTLDAGGQISRTVKGMADEDGLLKQTTPQSFVNTKGSKVSHTVPLSYETYDQLLDVGSEDAFYSIDGYLKKLKNNENDGQGDQYMYRAGKVSGGFTYNLSRQMVAAPFSDHVITRDGSNNYKVVAEDGTQYKFNASDAEYSTYISTFPISRAISNWMLSEMISADGADTIRFNYTSTLTKYEDNRKSVSISEGSTFQLYNLSYGYVHGKRENSYYSITSEERLLTSIVWRNGSIDFTASTELRKDKRKYKLATITVKDKSGRQVKKASFDYAYFLSRSNPVDGLDYRLKLTAVTVTGSDAQFPERYSFAYNESPVLPPYKDNTLDLNLYRGQDMWGYYNGVTTNTHLVGQIPSSARSYAENANRSSSESSMKACVLTRINLPTGGYTTFETEGNRDPTGKTVGGLRVKTIRMNDGTKEIVHSYTYEQPVYIYEPREDEYSYNMYVTHAEPFDIYGNFVDCFDGVTASNPRTFYTESPFSSWGNLNGSPVLYRKVTKNETGGSQTGNKTVSYYPNPVTYYYTIFGGTGYFYIPSNQYSFHAIPVNWAMGQPEKVEYYAQGVSTPVRTVTYEYITSVGDAVPVGHVVMERFILNGNLTLGNVYLTNAKDYYESFWVYAPTGYHKLSKKTEVDYFPDTQGSITKVTKYTYGNITSTSKRNLLLTEQTTDAGNGETITERYTYPQDYSTAPYTSMVAKNMLAYQVETTASRGSLSLNKQRVNYKQTWTNPQLIAPETLEEQQGASTTYHKNIQFYSYDKYGNPTQYTDEEGRMTVCIWGYRGTMLVAKVVAPVTATNYYTTVTNLIGAANMALLDGQPTDAQVRSIFTSLRSSLPQAHITSYSGLPLVGVTSVTDPSGRTTTYEYGADGNLKRVVDHNGHTVSSYQYHYKEKP